MVGDEVAVWFSLAFSASQGLAVRVRWWFGISEEGEDDG